MSWWLLGLAWADPVAVRAPVDAPGVSVGFHDLSIGGTWSPGRPWIAAELATNGASLGASIGQRWQWSRPDRMRCVQAGLAGGLLVPLVEPGLAVTGTGWLHAGWVGERGAFMAGAASPLAVGSGGSRMPLLFELAGAAHLGPVALGARLAAGPVFTPGVDVSAFLEPALTVQWEP